MCNISEILLELRTEQGISQRQLSEATGVSQSTIAKIELNRNEATASTVRKLAKYFHVSSDYLLGLEDDFGGHKFSERPVCAMSDEEREILECYRKLSPQMKSLALKTLDIWANEMQK